MTNFTLRRSIRLVHISCLRGVCTHFELSPQLSRLFLQLPHAPFRGTFGAISERLGLDATSERLFLGFRGGPGARS